MDMTDGWLVANRCLMAMATVALLQGYSSFLAGHLELHRIVRARAAVVDDNATAYKNVTEKRVDAEEVAPGCQVLSKWTSCSLCQGLGERWRRRGASMTPHPSCKRLGGFKATERRVCIDKCPVIFLQPDSPNDGATMRLAFKEARRRCVADNADLPLRPTESEVQRLAAMRPAPFWLGLSISKLTDDKDADGVRRTRLRTGEWHDGTEYEPQHLHMFKVARFTITYCSVHCRPHEQIDCALLVDLRTNSLAVAHKEHGRSDSVVCFRTTTVP